MTQRQYKANVWIGKGFKESMVQVWAECCVEADTEYKRTHGGRSFWGDAYAIEQAERKQTNDTSI